jgi:transposase
MSIPNTSLNPIIGIDICKKNLDIFISTSQEFKQFKNNEDGISSLLNMFEKPPALVICEATGGYEIILIQRLMEAGWPVALVNPRQIRDFAKAKGTLAKNDRLDAKILAHFGEKMSPKPLETLRSERLVALLRRREQLVDLLKKEKQHLDKSTHQDIIVQIKTSIFSLETQKEKLDHDIQIALHEDQELQKRVDILESIKGVGKQTAAVIAVFMPELGNASHEQVTALAGLAPFTYESGQFKGKTHIRGGRKRVRNALYMAALSAIQFNPDIKSFYQGLKMRHKPFKVAITATMRKLLKTINSLIKNNRKWTPILN